MPISHTAYQRERWQRHDADLWLRHDAWRFVQPGKDPADVYPTLARKREREREEREAAEAREFAAAIEQGRRVLAWCRAELAEVKAEMARRKAARQEESKYSPTQPRVPGGDPAGGQWTGGSGGSVAQLAKPMGQCRCRRSERVERTYRIVQYRARYHRCGRNAGLGCH